MFDRHAVLHSEPERLLADDMRSDVQAHSMLSLIGQGCHRLSEIAGRIGKPAGHLSRPLAQLIDLGHIRRDMPFGETTRSTKRTLYRLNDPFLAFWYRYVQPHRSMLEQDRMDIVFAEYEKMQAHHIAGITIIRPNDVIAALRCKERRQAKMTVGLVMALLRSGPLVHLHATIHINGLAGDERTVV
ncbi:MAG: hypothetical protein VX603_05240 [Gemmatimonadota bacterium]|nr:hypothetical protein [Gemmatimonadota bacterium]